MGFRSGDAKGQKAAARKLGQLAACRVCWQGGWPCQAAAAQVVSAHVCDSRRAAAAAALLKALE